MNDLLITVEKSDPVEGIIVLCIGKARSIGDLGDRDGQGFAPDSHKDAFQWWCDNYGRTVRYTLSNGDTQTNYVGLYDTHKAAVPGKLMHHWYDYDKHLGFVAVKPNDPTYAQKAQAGRIRCSVAGAARVQKVNA